MINFSTKFFPAELSGAGYTGLSNPLWQENVIPNISGEELQTENYPKGCFLWSSCCVYFNPTQIYSIFLICVSNTEVRRIHKLSTMEVP